MNARKNKATPILVGLIVAALLAGIPSDATARLKLPRLRLKMPVVKVEPPHVKATELPRPHHWEPRPASSPQVEYWEPSPYRVPAITTLPVQPKWTQQVKGWAWRHPVLAAGGVGLGLKMAGEALRDADSDGAGQSFVPRVMAQVGDGITWTVDKLIGMAGVGVDAAARATGEVATVIIPPVVAVVLPVLLFLLLVPMLGSRRVRCWVRGRWQAMPWRQSSSRPDTPVSAPDSTSTAKPVHVVYRCRCPERAQSLPK